MKITKYILIAAIALLSPQIMAGDMYKCSNKGVVAYQHTPCAESSEQTVLKEKKLSKLEVNTGNIRKNFQSSMDEHDNKTANKQAAAAEKFQLIDQKYAIELQQAEGNVDRIKDIENQKRQAKLPIYQELADFLEEEKKKLADVYETESQAAKDNRKALVDLERSHKEELRKIDRMGN